MQDQAVGTVLAFDNPWQIAGLIGLAVSLRLWGAYSRIFDAGPIMHTARSYVLEFLDSALIALLLVFCTRPASLFGPEAASYSSDQLSTPASR